MGETMRELLVLQSENIAALSRALTNFKKLAKVQLTTPKLRSRLTILKETWEKCQGFHARILLTSTEDERRTLPYFKDQEFVEAEAVYLDVSDSISEAIGKLQAVQSEAHNRSSDSSYRDATAASPIQLPRIQLPKFSGKLTEWANFKGIFESLIAGNDALSAVQKMHYLKACVTDDAARLIENLQISEANYDAAWRLLTDEYDNSFAIVTAHIHAFADLPAMRSESSTELKRLRDIAASSLAALGTMGRPVESWDDLLVYILVRKLSDRTRREWNIKRGDYKECPTYRDLSEFMTNRIRGLADGSGAANQGGSSARSEKPRGSVHAVSGGKCFDCTETHALHKCPTFLARPVGARWQLARQHKLCFNCLTRGHFPQKCPSKSRCTQCQRAHHTKLHREAAPDTATRAVTPAADNVTLATQSSSKVASEVATVQSVVPKPSGSDAVLLATAWVKVSTAEGRTFRVRALLDQGSTFSFISETLCQTLRTRRQRVNLPIRCFGEKHSGSARSCVRLRLSSHFNDEHVFPLLAYSYQRITAYAASRIRPLCEWSHLRDLPLADPDPSSRHPIQLLIGADLYGTLLRNEVRQGPPGSPTAQSTALGWIISGPAGASSSSVEAAAVNHICMDAQLDALLQNFWADESIPPPASMLTADEERCETFFQATHSRDASGRYMVRLPFKNGSPPEIGASRAIAERMLVKLNSRLARNPEIAVRYDHFLTEYETLSHMQRIPLSEERPRLPVYLPHHPVMRENSPTTKLRVVFNASCRTSNGTSLNDHLLIGPKLQPDLAAIILRWRMCAVVCTADIEKMYRQIRIHPADADYQRILWQPLSATSPISYRLLTVTYGTASAPYLALRVLRQLRNDEGDRFPQAAAVLDKSTYVDDVLVGADSAAELLDTRDQLIALLKSGGFILRKWNTNAPEVLCDLPDEMVTATRVQFKDEGNQKILGLSWHPREDVFQFSIEATATASISKRAVLSCVARLYDPLGWVAPVIITAKILMQEMWLARIEWDEPLPTDIRHRWIRYREQLTLLSQIRIPRWVGRHRDNLGVEIHGFADASSRAYAAAVYLRVIRNFSEIHVNLMIAKTKVAPVKTVSIPRLELNAMVLLSRLVDWVSTSLDCGNVPRYGWTDSTVALAWLSQHPSRWKPYVANRVSEIQTVNPPIRWHHVGSAENPADCASRGISASDLASLSLWWSGPSWLLKHSSSWPNPTKREGALRAINTEAAPASVQTVSRDPEWGLPDLFSTWTTLVRVTAYVMRFVFNVKARRVKHATRTSHLTREEIKRAEVFWLSAVQVSHFSKECESWRKTGAISRSSRLRALQPFLGADNLLRLGGRLACAPLRESEKYPIILANHRVVHLLIDRAHKAALHGGPQLTLRCLRQQFWIISARSLVKQHIRNCVTCVRNRAKPMQQEMASLPANRVNPAPPFSIVGLDYAGPFLVTAHAARGQRTSKYYVAVFVCFTTKAVHLEGVDDYTTAAFLAAFARFTSRRGLPSHVYSDNGTNFRGADRELHRAWRSLNCDESLQASVVTDGITWHFSPPAAPHFGGLWEAAVKSFKLHFKRIAGARTLSRAEFTTLLCKIEACLNSRPIAASSDDPSDLTALTPGHFLIGRPMLAAPEESVVDSKPGSLSRWQQVRAMQEAFWRRWSQDYLHTLCTRSKWTDKQSNVRIGTVVLLKDNLLPPTQWKLARIIATHPGSDGLVRVVTLRTATSEFRRPIAQICRLPIGTD